MSKIFPTDKQKAQNFKQEKKLIKSKTQEPEGPLAAVAGLNPFVLATIEGLVKRNFKQESTEF